MIKKLPCAYRFFDKFFYLSLVIFLLGISGNSFAQEENKIYHPLTNSVLLSLEYSTTISETDYDSNILSFAWRGSGEYFLPMYQNLFAGIRLYGGTGYLTGKRAEYASLGFPVEFKTSIVYAGLGIELGYRVEEKFYPYAMVGVNYLYFYPNDSNGLPLPNYKRGTIYNTHTALPSIEIGTRYFVNDNIAVNASITHNFFTNDYLDNLKKGYSKDSYSSINLGVSYALFTEKDSDNDGVDDKRDQCPGTMPGVKVDDFGCPLDGDNDGVPDYMDKCPFTPKGVKVDPDGCPVDSDLDGVPDYLDRCANTPAGVKVDNNGCPLDSDRDGVPDYLDKCPATPLGTAVDEEGCPKVKTPEQKPAVVVQPTYNIDGERMARRNIWTDGKTYVIQVASFRDKNTAYGQMQKWKEKGYNAFVESKYIKIYKTIYYRVRIGYYNTLKEAQAVYNKLGIK